MYLEFAGLPVGNMGKRNHLGLSNYLDITGYFFCIVFILYFSFRWGTTFFDPFLQNDDCRTSIFPFWAMHEDLFPNDYIARAMGSYTPWLIKFLYYFFTLKIDLLMVTKIIQIIAIAWGSFHVFQIGRRRAGGFGGLFALYLALHTFEMLTKAGGGHGRAFAMPVILMCIDGIDRNSKIQGGLGAILGFALYPPAGLIALGTYCTWYLYRTFKMKKNFSNVRKEIIAIGIVILLCFFSLSPTLFSDKKEFGHLYSYEQAYSMPEFGMEGRLWVIPLPTAPVEIVKVLRKLAASSDDSPTPYLKSLNDNNKKIVFLLFLVLAPLLALCRVTSFSFVALHLVVVGILFFGIAKFFAFHLYSPARMITYSLPCAYLLLIVSSYTGIGGAANSGNMRRIMAFAAFVVFICFQGIAFEGPIGLDVNAHNERELFQELKKLPSNALFAGHPLRIDNVPLWGKRSILVSYETSQPWHDKAWKEIKQRIYDNFRGYYAFDTGPLKTLRQKYGVDYMLVHEDDISPSYASHCKYFEPFNKQLNVLCKTPPENLIWRQATSESIVAVASGYMIINLSSFIEEFEKIEN